MNNTFSRTTDGIFQYCHRIPPHPASRKQLETSSLLPCLCAIIAEFLVDELHFTMLRETSGWHIQSEKDIFDLATGCGLSLRHVRSQFYSYSFSGEIQKQENLCYFFNRFYKHYTGREEALFAENLLSQRDMFFLYGTPRETEKETLAMNTIYNGDHRQDEVRIIENPHGLKHLCLALQFMIGRLTQVVCT
jgi:hypothetical protein